MGEGLFFFIAESAIVLYFMFELAGCTRFHPGNQKQYSCQGIPNAFQSLQPATHSTCPPMTLIVPTCHHFVYSAITFIDYPLHWKLRHFFYQRKLAKPNFRNPCQRMAFSLSHYVLYLVWLESTILELFYSVPKVYIIIGIFSNHSRHLTVYSVGLARKISWQVFFLPISRFTARSTPF